MNGPFRAAERSFFQALEPLIASQLVVTSCTEFAAYVLDREIFEMARSYRFVFVNLFHCDSQMYKVPLLFPFAVDQGRCMLCIVFTECTL